MLTAVFQNHPVSAVSPQTLHATSDVYSKEQLVDSSVGVSNYTDWRKPTRSSKQKGAEPDAFWQEFCRTKKLGKTTSK